VNRGRVETSQHGATRRDDHPRPERIRVRWMILALNAVAALAGVIVHAIGAFGQTDEQNATAWGVIPDGYREWRLISVAHEEGSLNDLRAILGNDLAIDASRKGTLPYPDGAMIARLAWNYNPLAESERAFGHPQSFVPGPPKNGVQFMIKDSRKYPATGGWGFAQFDDGKPDSETAHNKCFSCHAIVKARDFVFNRYAP
jgi:Cytochrome P460